MLKLIWSTTVAFMKVGTTAVFQSLVPKMVRSARMRYRYLFCTCLDISYCTHSQRCAAALWCIANFCGTHTFGSSRISSPSSAERGILPYGIPLVSSCSSNSHHTERPTDAKARVKDEVSVAIPKMFFPVVDTGREIESGTGGGVRTLTKEKPLR